MTDKFTFRRKWLQLIDGMNAEEQQRTILAICRYGCQGTSAQDLPENIAYTEAVRDIDADRHNRERNKKYAPHQKAGTAKNTAILATANTDTTYNTARKKEVDTVNIYKTKKENIKKEQAGKKASAVALDIPAHLANSQEFRQAWTRWNVWRVSEKRKPVTPSAARLQLKKLAQYPAHIAVAMIDQSIQNDYQGIFPLKELSNVNKSPYKPVRDYNGF